MFIRLTKKCIINFDEVECISIDAKYNNKIKIEWKGGRTATFTCDNEEQALVVMDDIAYMLGVPERTVEED